MDLLTLPRAALATSLGVATAVRGARVFHPHGVTRRATLTVTPTSTWGARLLDEPAVHEGVVRLSRGVGLPEPLPDVEGLALRLPGLGTGGAPLDILINSAWRYAFAPSVLSPTWSAVLPHRTGDRRLVLLGARPHKVGFTLLAAAPLGRWQPWAELALGEPVAGEQIRFAPAVGAPDLVPVQLFRTLRAWSYEASSAGRDDGPPAQ
ncbi:hypothetical protein BH24ACT10_BH24ACT10_13790 [soil metagenome]